MCMCVHVCVCVGVCSTDALHAQRQMCASTLTRSSLHIITICALHLCVCAERHHFALGIKT